tara:strand:+ start:248 stop:451 length:204 start_codon:yes stop_codon:yes gene_type:complete
MKIDNSIEQEIIKNSLTQSKTQIQEKLKFFTDKLNGSDSISEIRWFDECVKIQKRKLKSINNLLKKL